jgi:hypothetical protein
MDWSSKLLWSSCIDEFCVNIYYIESQVVGFMIRGYNLATIWCALLLFTTPLFSVIIVSLVKFLHSKTCRSAMDLCIFVDWDC